MKTFNYWRAIGLLFCLFFIGIAAAVFSYFFGPTFGWGGVKRQIYLWLLIMAASCALLSVFTAGLRITRGGLKFRVDPANLPKDAMPLADDQPWITEISEHLRYRYGRRWKHKVTFFCIFGDASVVEQAAPGLTYSQWLEGESVVLLWGGEPGTSERSKQLKALKVLRRRPVDAMIWVASEDSQGDAAQTDIVTRKLQQHYQQMGWKVPLYLWQVCASDIPQHDRESQPVGFLLPAECNPADLVKSLELLMPRLIKKGMQQVMSDCRHDFLLRLAQQLANGGIERIRQALLPLISEPQSVRLAGMMFSLPAAAHHHSVSHGWLPDASWKGIIKDAGYFPLVRQGINWRRTALWGVIGLATLWGIGSIISFLNNRMHIIENGRLVATLQQQSALSDRLLSQQSLQREISRLQHNAAEGAPWPDRFGLDQTQPQLAALWPRYQQSNDRLMRDAVVERLQQELALIAGQSARAKTHQPLHVRPLYNTLKAYLMMARPDKVEPAFLAENLARVWPHREGVTDGVWQSTAPSLLAFYAQNLSAHPEWAIKADARLVNEARTALLRQSVRLDMENELYQKLLQQMSHQFPEMTLDQLVGDTDASLLFTNDSSIPGLFTRQAWEQRVRGAIDKIVRQRGAEADWVLSDNRAHEQDLSGDDLKARLRERYFSDFASVWLEFLNTIRWQQAATLSDAIDQLTLMADIRQSPLSALMKSIAWQAATGQSDSAVSGTVEQSTRGLFSRDEPRPENAVRQAGPLDSTFGPLLAIMNTQTGSQSNNNLNLQTFLTRVTRVRLKLEQITNAPDPQAMAQALAQTVFQGKTVDLTDTRDYGSLLAASLGQEWGSFGNALFVQPVDQAWQQVLTPTASSLNAQWQHSIVDEWNAAFEGRYPFRATQSDASLPLLAQYLRADSGRISRFLSTRLSGVLHKEGNQWVPDAMNTQGMQINPQFLRSINQLSQLADVIFANGDAGMHFELMARPARDIVQTDLTIDGQDIKYFNQMESWHAIGWPGNNFRPGVMLTWTSTTSGNREYANLQGTWGLIRLLEKAQVTPIDSSRYQIVWRAQDGLPLNYVLRTELGKGPLALLELKGFRLPETIFLE